MSPYKGLSPDRFWSTGVAAQHPMTVEGLYQKKFDIGPDDRIGTAGSCFAQHIAGHLRQSGYSVMDVEPAPQGMTDASARRFGYRIYSGRFGNIYLVRQLLQLLRESRRRVPRADIVWEKNGRYYDALRPSVEPDGLPTPEEVIAHRERHLARVDRLFRSVDVFIFTMGLTEGWINTESRVVYPTCPGTIAGTFDPAIHAFKNFTVDEIYRDFVQFRQLIKERNPNVKFLVTVSPVPLKATAAGKHVLTATTYSKSVLRAVAGQLYENFDDIDYFPSYEIISSPWSKGFFFAPDLREVTPGGVETVMRVFSQQHPPAISRVRPAPKEKVDLVCEEELLGAFQP